MLAKVENHWTQGIFKRKKSAEIWVQMSVKHIFQVFP